MNVDQSEADRTTGTSTPIAFVNMTALTSNARRIAAEDGTDPIFDLRANAWGFDLRRVSEVVLAAGISASKEEEMPADVAATERLYGFTGAQSSSVLSLHGTVLSAKPLRRGEGVSYGYRYRARHDTNVALVTGGYAQGIVRMLGNRAHVTVAGARCPIVGRVAMDVSVIDVGTLPIRRGDSVVYLGDHLLGETTVQDWSAMTGMTTREIAAGILTRARTEHIS
ncbi:alanine racemase [Microbacterium halimionae]|uniref:Alanine racemase n=1 Tax=Microbacterium halimionae TaxID=1526413 RepID=A0A7W3JNE5_9MICO|nr:alanine racemase C-terminal domain-containing protein [Microbacterium halimionae]MBA8816067.1 alanine racemase [Microbacterium halimionae]NII96269.1 alanine racemase [Microbacterium halimionae]